jgi:hypothetical protein
VPNLFKNQQFEDNGIKVINSSLGVDMDNIKLKVASQPPRDAQAIREILKTKGHLLLMKNSFTGRIARICQMPDGNYGVQIVEWDLITNE